MMLIPLLILIGAPVGRVARHLEGLTGREAVHENVEITEEVRLVGDEVAVDAWVVVAGTVVGNNELLGRVHVVRHDPNPGRAFVLRLPGDPSAAC